MNKRGIKLEICRQNEYSFLLLLQGQIWRRTFGEEHVETKPVISCDRSHKEYDLCSINGATVVNPVTSTFFLMGPTVYGSGSIVEKIKPFPRKWESFPMKRIKEVSITSAPSATKCEVRHNSPAIVFAAGGYTGNVFHDFNDGFIPLFITIRSLYKNQDVILVVSKARDWWINRYKNLLRVLTSHPIVNLDNDTSTHCFPSATLGLISYGFMTLMPNPSQTLLQFRALLDKAFSHHVYSTLNLPPKHDSRPRLVFLSRPRGIGREILNQGEVIQITKEIGFDVVLFQPTGMTSLQQIFVLLNSSHAMIGIHGAALMHSLFLRPGSVFMQVMPLGTNWVGKMCYGEPARAMGIDYIEYKINVEESSLVEKYDKDDIVIKDPGSFQRGNWSSDVMSIYLKEQNVKLDLVRFREYLNEIYRKAKVFMDKMG
ncbi:alpha-1,3-arabinosyltransferase XAT3-like [Hibiscus syriacus]|uniref:alpha-1,3-arabinosyltransferase XAT3-like n=1 Tax=Hibiscus syriacus TaxID=106335 RepID=UPI001921AA67|nr:alpha-1,3-arabinosyltransferase XAT3-like [Hibiscus syriacus]